MPAWHGVNHCRRAGSRLEVERFANSLGELAGEIKRYATHFAGLRIANCLCRIGGQIGCAQRACRRDVALRICDGDSGNQNSADAIAFMIRVFELRHPYGRDALRISVEPSPLAFDLNFCVRECRHQSRKHAFVVVYVITSSRGIISLCRQECGRACRMDTDEQGVYR
jgi:hypothetical protein